MMTPTSHSPSRSALLLAGLHLLAIALASCVAPRENALILLQPGQWIEAKGNVVDGQLVVSEVEELDRSDSDTADKIDISYKADTDQEAGSFEILGKRVRIQPDTEYETIDQELVDPFPVRSGDWMKAKLRLKGVELHVRTIRRMEERDFFKVEGEVAAIDPQESTLTIGTIEMKMSQEADLDLIGIRNPNDPLSLFLADDQKSVPFTVQLSDEVRMGGQLFHRTELERNFDLDSDRKRDRWKLTEEAKLDVLWLMGNGGYALVEAKIGRVDNFRENRVNDDDSFAALSRAFASLPLHENVQLLAGRQDFDEEREWLYDEVLDGIRFMARKDQLQGEVSASIGREFLEETNPTEDTAMFTGLVRYWLDTEHRLTAYAIKRTDSNASDFEPLLLGLRSYARPSRGLGHWAELAFASGHAGARDISGTAIDLGVLYRFDTELRPTLYAGYAWGSGRSATASKEGFRQTGLQDNNGKFGGVTSFRYYGEVLEPELSNLSITTLGFGLRPMRDMSADLVFHTYRQDTASPVLVEDELRPDPTGSSRDIGWEVDLVLGYRFQNRLHLELLGGHFEPGNAFAENDPAQKVQFQIRFNF